ncbi:MAG: PTS transporter subunit EIIC [Oscillospiraceae bacterium]|nr:PTS transporter subunit EIIC [Oscillospiraceae bacterium]
MTEKRSFSETAMAVGDKIGGNIYLQSVSQGIMALLPVIIIGSFASLLTGLPVAFWQSFIQSTGLSAALTAVVAATTNMLGVYFTYGIASAFASKSGITSKLVPLLAIAVYLALLPAAAMENGTAVLSFDYLGTQGMILGILIAFMTGAIYKKVVDANIVIKMPEGTPDYVSNSFVALIPGFIIIIVTIILRILFALTPWNNAFDCLYNVLQIPLNAVMGENVIAMTISQFLTQVLWTLGIHPGFLSSLTAPVLFGLDGMNQAAYAASQPIPSVIGMAFSYSTTIATLYPAFAVAILLFSKSTQLKTVGRISVLPAFFGISEPLMFGVPVVLNPILAIPWIITPMLNFVLAFVACSSGIVARYAGVTVFNFPMVVTGILNGSLSIAIMEIVLFVIDILIYMPFIKIQDKKYLEDEKALSTEAAQN